MNFLQAQLSSHVKEICALRAENDSLQLENAELRASSGNDKNMAYLRPVLPSLGGVTLPTGTSSLPQIQYTGGVQTPQQQNLQHRTLMNHPQESGGPKKSVSVNDLSKLNDDFGVRGPSNLLLSSNTVGHLRPSNSSPVIYGTPQLRDPFSHS